MADAQRIVQLVEGLREATAQGRLVWARSIAERLFKLSLDYGIVWLEEDLDEPDGDMKTSYNLWIENKDGAVVTFESFEDPTAPDFALVRDLYRAVQRQIVRQAPTPTDELIDRLIATVNAATR